MALSDPVDQVEVRPLSTTVAESVDAQADAEPDRPSVVEAVEAELIEAPPASGPEPSTEETRAAAPEPEVEPQPTQTAPPESPTRPPRERTPPCPKCRRRT